MENDEKEYWELVQELSNIFIEKMLTLNKGDSIYLGDIIDELFGKEHNYEIIMKRYKVLHEQASSETSDDSKDNNKKTYEDIEEIQKLAYDMFIGDAFKMLNENCGTEVE